MHQVLIIAGIIGILFFLRWIRKQPRNKQIQATLILIAAVLVGLALAGRLNWLFAVAAAAAASFQKFAALLRFVPLFERLFTKSRANNPEADGNANKDANPHSKMTVEEAHKILGVDEHATKEEIIEAHRKLIQKIHPDRGGNDYLAAKINHAKDYLLKKTA